ncbi:hypothetical protein LTR27_000152 [Elasticomyces elasticus]|nr:hypothetical protein LTR27_000152 [Elasticomyces elasticus]
MCCIEVVRLDADIDSGKASPYTHSGDQDSLEEEPPHAPECACDNCEQRRAQEKATEELCRAITALVIFATGLIVQGLGRLAVCSSTEEDGSLGDDVIAFVFGVMLLGIALVLAHLVASSGTSPPPRLLTGAQRADARETERKAVKEPKYEREEWQGFSDDEQNPTSASDKTTAQPDTPKHMIRKRSLHS